MSKTFKNGRRRVCAASLVLTLSLAEFVWAVCDAMTGRKEFLPVLALALLLGGAGLLLLRTIEWTAPAGETAQALAERYAKRVLHDAALLITALFLFLGAELSFYFFGNSKAAELWENVVSNLIVPALPCCLLLKNALCLRLVKNGLSDHARFCRHLLAVCCLTVLYWLAVTALAVQGLRPVQYPANLYLAAALLYLVLAALYVLVFRRKLMRRNLVFDAGAAILTALAVLLVGFVYLRRDTWYTMPYLDRVAPVAHRELPIAYDDESGVYTITSDGDFKILHLTDIHLGNSLFSYRKDIKALQACYAEIAYTEPDLVIVTGDLCFPLGIMSMSFNNAAPVRQFAHFMRSTGVPWAFTYGNHDTESIASLSRQGLNEVYKSLSFKTSGNLLYPYVQPAVTGRNNQLIELRHADGSLNTALFLLDSNAYTGEGINVYDYIHDDQVGWYEAQVKRLSAEAGHTVPSLAFFHIPLQQYRTAYELYEAGSPEVTYYFGENGEKMIDKVCCSDYPSALFDRMLALGSTSGVFCGHDHYNNMSLGYRGIRLTYGMSIDYLAMPGIEYDTAQRGAELITIRPDASWDVCQIPLSSIKG